MFFRILKKKLRVLNAQYSSNEKQDASEFFVHFLNHIYDYLPQNQNYKIKMEQQSKCTMCNFESNPQLIEDCFMNLSGGDFDSVNNDVLTLFKKSFQSLCRTSKCFSDTCGGGNKDTLHIVHQTLLQLPEYLTIVVNRLNHTTRGVEKIDSNLTIEETLDLENILR